MAAKTTFTDPKPAGTTIVYKCVIEDESGNAIAAANLSTLTLSIVDAASRQVVNGVSAVSILNTGRGTVDASGNLVLTLLPADTALLVSTDSAEDRSLLLAWTYSGGKVGEHEAQFTLVAQ